MATKGTDGHRARRPGVVSNVKRGGPPRAFWLALAIVAVAGIGALAYLTSRPKSTVTQVDPSLPALKAEGHVLGSATAPVEVTEFGDFECPVCGIFANVTEPDIRTNLVNTGKVRIRFMDYPLPMHKNTWDAHLAAACADAQGKFWPMHDALFANQDKWNGEATSRPRGPLGELAKGIGLDMPKYEACMDADTYRPQIQATQAEAEKRQIGQTPTFVFNGTVVPGAIPFDKFKQYADSAATKAVPRADSAAKGATATPAKKP